MAAARPGPRAQARVPRRSCHSGSCGSLLRMIIGLIAFISSGLAYAIVAGLWPSRPMAPSAHPGHHLAGAGDRGVVGSCWSSRPSPPRRPSCEPMRCEPRCSNSRACSMLGSTGLLRAGLRQSRCGCMALISLGIALVFAHRPAGGRVAGGPCGRPVRSEPLAPCCRRCSGATAGPAGPGDGGSWPAGRLQVDCVDRPTTN